MTTPNQMPNKPNKIRMQVLSGLIALAPYSWQRKSLSRDEDGKEVVTTTQVTRAGLRYPLAQNVSEESVENLAKRLM